MKNTEITRKKEGPQYLQDSLGFLVNSLARLMRNALELRLQSSGLTPTTWTILMALGEEDGLSQTDLSRRTFLDGATITRTLDQLEQLNYLERRRDETDRRVQNVVLTDAGRRAYLNAARFGNEINYEATKDLTPAARIKLEENIRQIIATAQTLLNSEAPGGK
jgi:MarR family transcriptional regulator for hemolysin